MAMDNIKKLYIANFTTGFIFWYSIEKLFMHSIGISSLGIAINAIIYIAFTTVFDIPTGILADKWNRKYTLMLGAGCLLVSSVMLGMSHSALQYMLATVVWSMYMVFTSGTFQAMTYDSLHEIGRQNEYVKHQGRSYGMFLVGVSLGSVAGGYIASHFGYRASYFLTVIPCVISLFVLWSMHEPAFHKDVEDTKLWQHVMQAVHLLTRKQFLLYLSSIAVGMGMLASSQIEYAGLYYIALGMGAIGSGYAYAGGWLFGTFGQFLSNKLAPYTKISMYVFFLGFLVFSVWQSPFGILFFYLATFSFEITKTNVEGVIQHQTPSSIRATTLSILSFLTSILMIPTSIAFGFLARSDIFHSYQMMVIIGAIFLVIWYFRPRAVKLKQLYVHPDSVATTE